MGTGVWEGLSEQGRMDSASHKGALTFLSSVVPVPFLVVVCPVNWELQTAGLWSGLLSEMAGGQHQPQPPDL